MVRKVLPKIEIEHRQGTREHGEFSVVGNVDGCKNKFWICFDESGHKQIADLSNIRSGRIADQSRSLKYTFVDRAVSIGTFKEATYGCEE